MTTKIGNTPAMGKGSKRGRTPRSERQSRFEFQSTLLKRSLVDMHKTPTKRVGRLQRNRIRCPAARRLALAWSAGVRLSYRH